jgi:hypothetical protein
MPSELGRGGVIAARAGRVLASGVETTKRERPRDAKPRREIQSRRERRMKAPIEEGVRRALADARR